MSMLARSEKVPMNGARCLSLTATVCLSCLLSACASNDGQQSTLSELTTGSIFSEESAPTAATSDSVASLSQSYAAEPRNPATALNYARLLKQQGEKRKAFSILGHSFSLNPQNAQIASAYGRLALDLGEIQTAERVLPIASQLASAPDWRLLSAQGTVAARRKKYDVAQRYFQQALSLAPNQPTVMNNLALVYALNGKLKDAEDLLRKAFSTGSGNERLKKNLALIMKMRGSDGALPSVAASKPKKIVQPRKPAAPTVAKKAVVAKKPVVQKKPPVVVTSTGNVRAAESRPISLRPSQQTEPVPVAPTPKVQQRGLPEVLPASAASS